MKIVATDYKGKHFVLCDEDMVDDMDYIIPYIDIAWVIEHGLESHVADCWYYGIPAYYGKNEELKKRIAEIEESILKEEEKEHVDVTEDNFSKEKDESIASMQSRMGDNLPPGYVEP